MRPSKASPSASATPPPTPPGALYWRFVLWGVWAFNSLFYLPQCLDRSLAPRFFCLSLILLAGVLLLWKTLRERADWRLHGFDLLLLAWYGLNAASVGWAFSWSEAVFYTQKVLLLFTACWLLRQALVCDEATTRQALRQATIFLSFAVSGILLAQLAGAASRHGLDNQRLYELDWFLFGNKSLAAEFLFFLLIFNVLFAKSESARRRGTWEFQLAALVLTILMLLLQTRTVYLALVAGALAYVSLRAWAEPGFSTIFRKKILPAGVLALALLASLVAWKGSGNSLAERLNPLTYLESGTANERRFVWYKTDLLNADHFWLGVGNGSWKFWFPSKNIQGAYRLQEQNVVFTRAHNDYLEIRAEMGIIGVVLFCALFVMAFGAAFWTLRRRETGTQARRDLPVLMAGLLGYCIIQYFDFPRERIEMQVVVAILFAQLVFHTKTFWARFPGIFAGKYGRVLLSALAAGLLFNLVVGWHRIGGEIHNVRVLQAQSRRDFPAMAAEAQAAKNRFYEYTDVTVPLDWHEGIAWYQMQQHERAATAFERAYRLNPWSFQVINNYASALVQTGRYREAIPLYERAVDINPRYEDGKFNAAYACYHTGEYPKALEWLDRVDTIPNPKTEEQRRQNAALRQRQADFRKTIEARMK